MGETRVDIVHLLEDLRDAYPGSIEETILTEIVANTLDSGARTLHLSIDRATSTLAAIDDGRGMTRSELTRYHNLGASTKKRGRGIGFAGVGIKLGLLVAEEVVTETRKPRVHVATSWALSNRSRAPWKWIDPPHYLDAQGTAVSLRMSNSLSHLLDAGFIEAAIVRHFQPLFEPEFIDILSTIYPEGLTIYVDGQVLVGPIRSGDRVPLAIRIGRQRRPSAVGYLARHPEPLPDGDQGIAISTLGKVIRRGWDWLGLTPAEGDRIEGLIEVPPLAEALTLNKGDFRRTGSAGALVLAYRKAIQEVVTAQLVAWGESTRPEARPSRTRPLERDLHRVLGDLAGEFPLLAALADRRAGGQQRLPLGGEDSGQQGLWGSSTALHASVEPVKPAEPENPAPVGAGHDPATSDPNANSSSTPAAPNDGPDAARSDGNDHPTMLPVPGRGRRSARARLSLDVRFESLPGEMNLGRLIDSTIWVNDAHPAYRRAAATRSEAYHLALTVASALAPLTVEPERHQEFVNAFLARWGEEAFGKRKRL